MLCNHEAPGEAPPLLDRGSMNDSTHGNSQGSQDWGSPGFHQDININIRGNSCKSLDSGKQIRLLKGSFRIGGRYYTHIFQEVKT